MIFMSLWTKGLPVLGLLVVNEGKLTSFLLEGEGKEEEEGRGRRRSGGCERGEEEGGGGNG